MNRDDRWPKANTKTTASDKASRRDRLLRRSETGSNSGYSRDFTGTDLPFERDDSPLSTELLRLMDTGDKGK